MESFRLDIPTRYRFAPRTSRPDEAGEFLCNFCVISRASSCLAFRIIRRETFLFSRRMQISSSFEVFFALLLDERLMLDKRASRQ
jgi:hypothetical protein